MIFLEMEKCPANKNYNPIYYHLFEGVHIIFDRTNPSKKTITLIFINHLFEKSHYLTKNVLLIVKLKAGFYSFKGTKLENKSPNFIFFSSLAITTFQKT